MTNKESWDKLLKFGYVQFTEVQNVDTENLPLDIVLKDGKYYKCEYTIMPENLKLLLEIERNKTLKNIFDFIAVFTLTASMMLIFIYLFKVSVVSYI